MKICTKCKTEKPLTEFYADRRTKDGKAFCCKVCANKALKEYTLKFPEKRKATHKKSKESCPSGKRQYLDKAALQQHSKKYYTANREKICQQKQEYRQTEKGKAVSINATAKRRALVRNSNIDSKLLQVVIKYATNCYWCGTILSKIQIDHYIPLALNGQHTISNIVASCPTCNLTKGAKYPLSPSLLQKPFRP